jgi:hypothetical protein
MDLLRLKTDRRDGTATREAPERPHRGAKGLADGLEVGTQPLSTAQERTVCGTAARPFAQPLD